MGENIHVSTCPRAYRIISPVILRTSSRLLLMVFSRWISDVGMNTWIMSTSQSMQASTSAFTDRASPQTFASSPSFLMAETVSFSAADDAGNPASIVWTPIAES